MASEEVIYTIAYMLISVCLVVPPNEFRAAGLTIQNIFSDWLGSEDIDFVRYHIKRSTATILFHSFLPLGYLLGYAFCFSNSDLLQPWKLQLFWQISITVSILLPLISGILSYYWSQNDWKKHPIALRASYHGDSWQSVAAIIDVEFRRIDKFQTGPPGRRVIVTDSWILQTSTYLMDIARQDDVHLNTIESQNFNFTDESTVGVQYISLNVISVNPNISQFTIRMNATEYGDFKAKLRTQIINVRNIIIQETITERFAEAFRQQVVSNGVYRLPAGSQEPDSCIGCMQVPANIKLTKLCDDNNVGDCVSCNCRPMWCLTCMSKWFASRQSQDSPQNWMSSKSPCPTCRSKFCMLDVRLVAMTRY
ncbi:E3 ubiquitin-protein ligase TM129-like [Anneissia japonica]|uniref:E3 ubiquitin-protein ligase TM129-like n=1 Tax=Anneissia japonica TaxID=1529436 RepID=UPI001425824C|nr:E3 ubiquitin-protein ligase TM129-like [Anneissia japonica]